MPGKHNFRIIAAVVASALFMQNIDATVVATALPSMARDLGVNPVHLSSAITSYLIALTVFIPISGWIADRFGAKRVFMAAIATFTLASVLCALASGLPALIAARVLQGIGGAMMVPVGRLILFRQVRREEMLSATTWLTMPALVGPVLGPPLGGFLTDAMSWRSVFWINVPFGLAGLLLSAWLIPPAQGERPPAPDLTGMALVGLALTTLMVGVEMIGRGLLPGYVPPLCIAAGLLLSWLSVRHCRRTAHPAIDFSLLRIPTFHAATVAGSLFRAGAGALPFLVPLTLQVGFGLSASVSGLISLASALGSFCMRPMTRFALHWLPMRTVLIAGSISFALMLAVCTTLSPAWPETAVFALLLCGGLSRSLSFASMGALAFADVPPARLSAATSFQGTAQQMTKAVGVAIAAGSMQLTMLLSGRTHAEHFDFACAFLAIAVLVLASWPMFAALPADAGEGVSGAPRRSST
ncbi:MFS transporter [Cupriavidus sp. USMAHM13]|uniref:MDR family MFS transporter n=1 Tax=Cupriavidus sp. USMAHM13 TaxID=1389192 RepID=UPI0008A6DD43|nr:MDR family MFS transporter [Cupriavidus sp. USMAHM13]AOY98496.1 MFS transporter [Cupriavidus sp. USMAHM13]